MTQRWLIYHWSHALKWFYTRSILTRNAASHERCRLCAVDLRCLTETAPDDHRVASCGKFSSGQTTATGTQLTWDLNCVLKHLSAHQKTHTNYVWKWNLCCVFLFPHFLILNLLWILFCALLWASARAKRPHRTTFSCELRQHKCEETKSNSTTKETK